MITLLSVYWFSLYTSLLILPNQKCSLPFSKCSICFSIDDWWAISSQSSRNSTCTYFQQSSLVLISNFLYHHKQWPFPLDFTWNRFSLKLSLSEIVSLFPPASFIDTISLSFFSYLFEFSLFLPSKSSLRSICSHFYSPHFLNYFDVQQQFVVLFLFYQL